ncbi:acireductone dioxygenase [Alkalihalobacillus alcalophilus ATCC 27647 = CGMCC 1.3604]|uniref:Acireductone dioxygenase n=1 Tax=Alkalihalobacillus alcalophilus ATCC 27647 = CGMCC 1.3604 TaxID=1218173 RepID=A0A094WG00_ALKAL|nr:cupin domain-containing protein [Alkalihalobacillus alcalophilus]KGA95701.1 acireductone dioxygenase [Alkalihalobacillus alcalophilus ATCC 27647 = CGMCC 1.3604]MED1564126.1 cupin domain-containing protein [Alkalihalobacillus alcalophilus]THG90589.1 acireductone dioxygenase [Alkalihalobacillus alcalophilus ATCC 27647 = CGMCC 1.3604]
MATLRFHDNDERLRGDELVSYLEEQGVIYEKWGTDNLPEHLVENFTLTDENKEEILKVYKREIADISARRGYLTADVISLSDSTPNLDELLKNFLNEHHHTDDEVRFIVSGHGIFAIESQDKRWFDVELEPGDLISVPEYYRHYFTLQEDRKVVAVRIFKTKEGWVPVYDKEEQPS